MEVEIMRECELENRSKKMRERSGRGGGGDRVRYRFKVRDEDKMAEQDRIQKRWIVPAKMARGSDKKKAQWHYYVHYKWSS